MAFNTKTLIKRGYRRTNNKYGLISRIDRPDWKEFMAKSHSPWNIEAGMRWVESLGESASDYYRIVYSHDTIEVGQRYGKLIPPSHIDPVEYIEITNC